MVETRKISSLSRVCPFNVLFFPYLYFGRKSSGWPTLMFMLGNGTQHMAATSYTNHTSKFDNLTTISHMICRYRLGPVLNCTSPCSNYQNNKKYKHMNSKKKFTWKSKFTWGLPKKMLPSKAFLNMPYFLITFYFSQSARGIQTWDFLLDGDSMDRVIFSIFQRCLVHV